MNLFDTANYPSTEPVTLVAGDSWAWRRSDLTDYDTSLYTLTYQARRDGDGTDGLSITASASGTDYLIEVAAATTVAYTPGTWRWSAFITRDSDSARVRIDSGTWEIKPDPATAAADPRSHAKTMLDGIEAILAGKASSEQVDIVSTALGSRSATRNPDLLRSWRAYYLAEYRGEQAAEEYASGGNGNTVRVSF